MKASTWRRRNLKILAMASIALASILLGAFMPIYSMAQLFLDGAIVILAGYALE